MKTIDCQPDNKNTGFMGQINATLNRYGIAGDKDARAQEIMIVHLSKLLSNRYILLQNVILEGLDQPIPGMLVGPSGIYIMFASALKGVYRAKDEAWLEMNSRTKQFEPARPNILARSRIMARAFEAFLQKKGYEMPESMGFKPEVQPVLFFSNPGTHVESIRPTARVVLADGLEHFVRTLTEGRSYFNGVEVKNIVDIVLNQETDEQDLYEDETELNESGFGKTLPAAAGVLTDNLNAVSSRFRLSTRQWIFLGMIAAVDIILLIGFIIFVLMTSSLT